MWPMCSKWYRQIKYKFMPDSIPARKLEATDPNGKIDDELLEAMMCYKSSDVRAKTDACVNLATHVNHGEFCGIYAYMLELKATTLSASLKCCLNVLRLVAPAWA